MMRLMLSMLTLVLILSDFGFAQESDSVSSASESAGTSQERGEGHGRRGRGGRRRGGEAGADAAKGNSEDKGEKKPEGKVLWDPSQLGKKSAAKEKKVARKTSKPAAKAVPEPEAPLTIDVPQSQLDLSRYIMPEVRPATRLWEVTASTWTPSEFHDSSIVARTGPYRSTGMPRLSLNTWRELTSESALNTFAKFGVSYDELRREGWITIAGRDNSIVQTMNVVSLRLGAAGVYQSEVAGSARPFAGVSLLPTWMQSPSSALNDGTSRVQLAIEESLGVEWRFPRAASWLGSNEFGIAIGFELSQGLLGSPLGGNGVFASTRLAM